MIRIDCKSVGKRFQFEWIFQKVDCNFQSENSYAILGNNGSGKSTLMLLLSGYSNCSAGKIVWNQNEKTIPEEQWYKHLSLSSPALELIEEFNLSELIRFQKKFKPFLNNMNEENLLDLIELSDAGKKPLKFYSSGMRQRVKLALAILSDTPVLMLDEPTTNLDETGVKWYLNMIDKYKGNRLIIVASNMEREYPFCDHHLNVMDWK